MFISSPPSNPYFHRGESGTKVRVSHETAKLFLHFFCYFFAGFMGVADNQQVAKTAINQTFPKT
jgi:hypothetical protein